MTIRVVVLTSSRRGTASHCLPMLAEHPMIDVRMVVHSLRQFRSRGRMLKRNLEKIRRIGPLGALVGYRMRKWYDAPPPPDLEELCVRYGIPFETTPLANGQRTLELFEAAQADLGLSLQNGVLFPKIFNLPRFGMINAHGEILPQFRGGASIIWNVYEGVAETGLTVHQIESKIDAGAILHQERWPIEFKPTFRETVAHNTAITSRRAPAAVTQVVANYERLRAASKPQGPGTSYTTPTLRQYLRMLRQHRKLRADAELRPRGH